MIDLYYLLGIQIEYFQDYIAIFETSYIDKIFHHFSLYNANPINLPLNVNYILMKGTKDTKILDMKLY